MRKRQSKKAQKFIVYITLKQKSRQLSYTAANKLKADAKRESPNAQVIIRKV